MKNLFLALGFLCSASLAHAQLPSVEGGVIVSERTVQVPVSINEKNVHFSQADYQKPVVKILIPALADLTLLDHRNTKEGAPCLAAPSAQTPDEVIQGKPAEETANLKITLKRKADLVEQQIFTQSPKQVCQVMLIEDIEGSIRGVPFVHERLAMLPNRNTADCR